MDIDYPITEVPATPEHVLAVLCDMHRQQCQYDPEAEVDIALGFDSTVAEWREACDLVTWRALAQAVNEMWGIHCSAAEWHEVLEPARTKRLEGVCTLIAAHARRALIRPSCVLGKTCTAAGAFLTVRSLLNAAGVQAEVIAPSTPLAPYTRQYYAVFLGPISRLAPNALPPVRINTPVYDMAFYGLLAGMVLVPIGFWVGLFVGSHLLTVLGVALSVFAYAILTYSARFISPSSVQFGSLRTFRDLAMLIANAQQMPDTAR